MEGEHQAEYQDDPERPTRIKGLEAGGPQDRIRGVRSTSGMDFMDNWSELISRQYD